MNFNICHSQDEYGIREVFPEDIESIRHWRNDQMNVLRQKNLITTDQQISYFNKNVFPLYQQDKPHQILFSYLFKDTLIGYGGLVHISWMDKRAEMSFLVEPNRANNRDIYQRDFEYFISLSKKVAFEELNFNRIYVETYAFRKAHIKILEASGMVLEGRMREHVFENGDYQDSLIHGYLKSEYYGAIQK